MHALLVEQGIEIVEHVCRGVTILRNEYMHASACLYQGGGIERKSSSDQIFEVDGEALFVVKRQHSSERVRCGYAL